MIIIPTNPAVKLPIALVGAAASNSSAGTLPAGYSAGNLLVAIWSNGQGVGGTVTDSGWTNSRTTGGVGIAWKIAANTTQTKVNFSGISSYEKCHTYAFSGAVGVGNDTVLDHMPSGIYPPTNFDFAKAKSGVLSSFQSAILPHWYIKGCFTYNASAGSTNAFYAGYEDSELFGGLIETSYNYAVSKSWVGKTLNSATLSELMGPLYSDPATGHYAKGFVLEII